MVNMLLNLFVAVIVKEAEQLAKEIKSVAHHPTFICHRYS